MDFFSVATVWFKAKIKNTIKRHFPMRHNSLSKWQKRSKRRTSVTNQYIWLIKTFSYREYKKNTQSFYYNQLIYFRFLVSPNVFHICVSVKGARVNLSARLGAMCAVADAGVFTVSVGNALLGLFGDSPLVMHERAGRHAPIISLWSKTANSASPQPTRSSGTSSPFRWSTNRRLFQRQITRVVRLRVNMFLIL